MIFQNSARILFSSKGNRIISVDSPEKVCLEAASRIAGRFFSKNGDKAVSTSMFALNPQLEDHLRTHDDNYKSDDATFTRDGNAQQIQVVVEAEKQSLAKDNIMIHNHQCHECRLQVSAILGFIQAPPLSSPESLSSPSSPTWVGVRCCEEEMHETDLTKQIEIVVNFAKVHANLFTSFQLALETISLGTGLAFGLGPSSQSVIRVEMATLGRAFWRLLRQGLWRPVEAAPSPNGSTPSPPR